LPLLQMLRLLLMLLLQLLRLLGVMLLHLAFLLFVEVALLRLLVFFFLLLLQLLLLLVLLVVELLLLLLVFLVQLGVAGVGRISAFCLRKFAGVVVGAAAIFRRTSAILSGTVFLWPRGAATLGRRMISASRFSGRYDFMTRKFSRTASGGDWRFPLVVRGAQFAVAAGFVDVMGLRFDRANMTVASRRFLFGIGASGDATRAAVEADAVDVDIHRLVVNVVNIHDVNVGNRAVVEEMSVIPASAYEADTEISEAVVDAAVEADVRSPPAFMEEKSATFPTPPRWSP
jgi:hypothetical protein